MGLVVSVLEQKMIFFTTICEGNYSIFMYFLQEIVGEFFLHRFQMIFVCVRIDGETSFL